MAERNRAVVRIVLLNENMAIETAHFLDCEHAAAAEAAGCDIKNLAFRNIRTEDAFRVALQTIEGDVGRRNVTLKGTAADIGLAAGGLQHTVLDQLILDRTVGAHLAGRSITAVEAHEGIIELIVILTLDLLIVHGSRNGVVDIEDGHRITGDAGAYVLRKRAIDIHFAGYRNAAARQTGVDIAGSKPN